MTAANPNVFSGANTALPSQIFANAHHRTPVREAARLGRGAHAHRHMLHPHDRRPPRHRPIRQVLSLGRSWNSLSRTPSPTSRRYPSRRPGSRSNCPSPRPSGRRAGGLPTAAGAPIFEVKDVSIYYGSFRAVTNVSLTIYEHQITAFIGPSGCGKTTVLRTLNRMNDLIVGAHVEGEVYYRGESAVRQGRLPDRRAPPHRHGLPEAEPVPQVDLRQRGLRAAHQRHPQQGQAERDRRALAAPGRAVGRGEEPPGQFGPGPVRRAGPAAVHRPHARRGAGRRAHGRARLRARPDRDGRHRGPDEGDQGPSTRSSS